MTLYPNKPVQIAMATKMTVNESIPPVCQRPNARTGPITPGI
ncbi:hypothetical protein [Paenibacillus lautus]